MPVYCKYCGALIARNETGYWVAPIIHVFEGKEFVVFTNDCPNAPLGGHIPDTSNWE